MNQQVTKIRIFGLFVNHKMFRDKEAENPEIKGGTIWKSAPPQPSPLEREC